MKKIYIYIILILFSTSLYAQSDEDILYLDSLVTKYKSYPENDTNKLHIATVIASIHYNVDSTVKYAKEIINISTKQKNYNYISRAYSYLSWADYHYNNVSNAIKNGYNAYYYADSLNCKDDLAYSCYVIGIAYSLSYDIDNTVDYYLKSINLYQQLNDTFWVSNVYKCLAEANLDHNLFEEAEKKVKEAYILDSLMNDSVSISEDLTSIAEIYLMQYYNLSQNPKETIKNAKKYILKAFEYHNEFDYIAFRTNYQLGNILNEELRLNKYSEKRRNNIIDSIKNSIEISYKLADMIGLEAERFDVDFNYASYLINCKKYNQAKQFLDSIYNFFQKDSINYVSNFLGIFQTYEFLYEAQNDYISALYYNKLANKIETNKQNLDFAIKTSNKIAQTEFQEKIQQHEIAENERELKFKYIIITISIIFILIFIFGIIIFRIWLKTKKQNKLLKFQKEEIEIQRENLEKQNNIISKKNNEIQSSIHYASLIQQSVLPENDLLNELFKEYYVIYKPKDIVTGDFYWANQIGKYKILATADSTGHGVPGAFMSLLGISILNEITHEISEDKTAGYILDNMKIKLKNALHQNNIVDSSNVVDGIDIALQIFDTEKHKLYYSGAYRPLWIVRNNQIIEYKADKMPIGVYFDKKKHFTNHEIDIFENDLFITFTDGLTDQYGYDENNVIDKFYYIRLRKLLLKYSEKSLIEQKQYIENEINNWKKNIDQIDDIILIGVKVI
ncbi:MAG: SpoIIE family protein phosphatase [Bacteroidales bacterium]|nr:SpoIIE family protein phosphatase [Bacteroidales bacterium]